MISYISKTVTEATLEIIETAMVLVVHLNALHYQDIVEIRGENVSFMDPIFEYWLRNK